MNSYQKLGVFLVRLVAVAMIVMGAFDVTYFVFHDGLGTVGIMASATCRAGAAWLIFAGILLLTSKPLGHLMGLGLG
jgi:hypothetical protein